MTQAPIENMKQLYTTHIWNSFCEKVENDFKLKTYPQFDPYFDFRRDKHNIQVIVSDSTFKKVKQHSFLPFLKVLHKTPRYKYQIGEDNYDLETKIRPISFASHFDTYIYAFYAFALTIKYQEYIRNKGFSEVVLAYRTDLQGKCNIQFAKETFDIVKEKFRNENECSVIALDIKGYFDHIDHLKLKDAWCKVIEEVDLPPDQYKVFRSLTKYSYVNYTSFLKHFNINLRKFEREQIKKHNGKARVPKGYQSLLDLIPNSICGPSFNDKMQLLRDKKLIAVNNVFDKTAKKRILKSCGIPQGSSMSALLSNVYLAEFDKEVFEKGQVEGFVYRRYCDDLLIVCKPDQVNVLKDFLMQKIRTEYKLIIQDKKTDVLDFKLSPQGKFRSYKRNYNQEEQIFQPLPNENGNFRNLQYLGFEFNGQNVYIRPGSLSRYFRKMKARIVKTISMSYSENAKSTKINRQQLLSRYSHFGKRNFLTYAYNASSEFYFNAKKERKEGMNSTSIKRQVAAHMYILEREVAKTAEQRAKQKL